MASIQTSSVVVQADPLLAPVLAARDEQMREAQIERLVRDVAFPVIDSVVRRHASHDWTLRREDADDLRGSVTLRVLRKLRTLGDSSAVLRFPEYVATLTRNAIHDVMRERYPERHRLKHRIRTTLREDRRLAAWTAGPDMLCGLREWQGRTDAIAPALPATSLLDRNRPAEALVSIFRSTGKPSIVDSIVDLLARHWSVVEAFAVDAEPASSAPTQLQEVACRRLLDKLWQEIAALRPLQRAALLLNLRDEAGGNAATYFFLLGIASFDAIAASLEVTRERLAELWNDLPLDDLTIASMYGLKRQQVINLRRAARDRLSRRIDFQAQWNIG